MTDAPSAPASPATILVVDEEVMVRFAIADYLRDCGYRVMEAASAKEAMLVMGTPDVLVDIVLCDAALKGEVNGYASARCQPVRTRCWMRRYYVGRETVASRENGQPFFVLQQRQSACFPASFSQRCSFAPRQRSTKILIRRGPMRAGEDAQFAVAWAILDGEWSSLKRSSTYYRRKADGRLASAVRCAAVRGWELHGR
jgi:hypothetical protein